MGDTTENKEEKANGYYYNENGEFLGKEGSSNKVYLAKKYEKTKDTKTDKITIKYQETQDLDITHDDFTYIGGIIKHEAGNNEITELKCISFASYNFSVAEKKTWRQVLASSYSSVPDKTGKQNGFIDNAENKTDSQKKSNNTRKAMIAVLTKETDLTKSATHWDGTDFLAWGTDENKYDSKTKIGHNKFKEYKFIEIPKDVYDSFLAANKKASTTYTNSGGHDMTKCSGKHEHLKKKNSKTGKDEYTGKIKYPMPASVFENDDNWSETCFYYATGVKTDKGISGTIAAGKSIFWKRTKDRLCTDSTSKKSENKHGFVLEQPVITMPIDNTRVVIPKRELNLKMEKIS